MYFFTLYENMKIYYNIQKSNEGAENFLKLSEYARKNSITYQTAWNHFKSGKIPNARQLPTGTVVIDETQQAQVNDYVVIYARVSGSENKSNLDAQADRLIQYCEASGLTVSEVVKECASGLDDSRPKLSKIFQDRKATKIVVEHKDRLTRFGYHYIELLYPECEIIVVDPCEDKQDLFEDFISLVTSFCARIYGRRRSRRKTEQIIEALNDTE